MVRGSWVVALGFAWGCTGTTAPNEPLTPGNQTGQFTGWCCDCGERTYLARDEAGPGGFTAVDVFAGFAAFDGTVSWIDGVQDSIHVAITEDEESTGNIRWIDAQEGDCEPYLDVPVWLTVTTGDGSLDAVQRANVTAYAADRGKTGADWYGDTLGGTLDLTRFVDPVNPGDARVFFFLELDEAGARGNVELDPQNEAGGTWQGAQPIASWSE